MRPSRGMGAVMPSKMGKKKTIIRKDNPNEVTMYKEGGKVWDKPNPVKKHKKLSPEQKTKAKAMAKAAGRPYPNMVDNIRTARSK